MRLGYEGGVGAFVTFAKNLGLDLIEMAKTMAGTFPDHIWAATARGYEWARIQEAKRPPRPGEKDDRPSYILDKKVWRTCDAIKRMWRESHPQTVAFWRDLKDGILAAVRNPGRDFWAGANIEATVKELYAYGGRRKPIHPGETSQDGGYAWSCRRAAYCRIQG